jgi:hypothetical protein
MLGLARPPLAELSCPADQIKTRELYWELVVAPKQRPLGSTKSALASGALVYSLEAPLQAARTGSTVAIAEER